MSEKERVSAEVSPDKKFEFKIAATRRDLSEAELLRQVVDEFLEGEDIPEDVREFFREEFDQGNPNPAAVATTAD